MLLTSRNSKDEHFPGAFKCEICAKNATLKERFENFHTVQSYYEQITMRFDKIRETPTREQNESDKIDEVEGTS